jgi:23S rRNA (cytosine1962-C5)-methyltransferase
MAPATLDLGPSLEAALASGHPWIYRNHLPRHALRTGDWVRVRAGRQEAYGIYDADGGIAVRLFRREGPADAAFLRARVEEALALRRLLTDRASPQHPDATDAYRLLNGEGDFLPGITADRYGRFAVMKAYSDGVRPLLPEVARALASGLRLKGVVMRSPDGLEPLWGELPPPEETVFEHGLRFQADLYRGQKTGLFLDHRDHRQWLRGVAAGRRVLNLFSYTGAFGVYALAGGAAEVLSVDIAEGAVQQAHRTVALNGLEVDRHEPWAADVFELLPRLAERRERYDLVVLDPPSLARNAEQRRRAQRAYLRLNRSAFRVVEPGGMLVTASCTAQVAPEAFQRVVAEAAQAAGVRAQLIVERGQPLDHPVPTSFPEGRYLKFLAYRVLAG